MTLKNLISKLDIISAPVGTDAIVVTDICYDSRKVKPGSLFICLTGGAADGHGFAKSAEDLGACAVVAEHQTDSTLPHILVRDSRVAMFELSAAWFGNPEQKMKFVGVTGTNGKTSTVFYIKSILDRMGKMTGLIGTAFNMIGDKELPSLATTPEPLALMQLLKQMSDSGVEYVIMEISSHSIVQKRVCGIHFDAAAFTNLTQDHLDYHGTMENYKAAKAELFDMADVAVLNIDDETGKELSKTVPCKKYTYSTIYNSADFVAKEIKIRGCGVKFLAVTLGGIAKVSVATPGAFTVSNLLAAIGSVCALGFEFTELMPHLLSLPGVIGRAQIISGERPYTVMIDYAHTPDGLENILSSVREYTKGRVVTLFGCGGDRDKTKRSIMGSIAAKNSDFVIVTSDNPRTEDPNAIIEQILPGVTSSKTPYTVIADRREAIAYAIRNARPDDMIVLAGKGHEKYQILGTEKVDFDEEKIAVEFMEEVEK